MGRDVLEQWERELIEGYNEQTAPSNGPRRRRTTKGTRTMGDDLAPLVAMSGRHAPRLQKAMTYYASAQMLYYQGKRVYEWYKQRNDIELLSPDTYTLFMEDDDALVSFILRKIQSTTSFENERVLRISSEQKWVQASPDERDEADDDGEVLRRIVTARPDEEVRPLAFTVEGHQISARMQIGKPGQTPNKSEMSEVDEGAYYGRDFSKYLVLTCHGDDAYHALTRWLDTLIEPQKRIHFVPSSTLYVYSKTNGWTAKHTTKQRSMDSVTLPEGRSEALMRDIEQFRDAEQDYVDYGVPYHRGYLLSGPPGTGKTSFTTTLASHLGIDLYMISLSELKTNEDLTRAVTSVEGSSIILFEDVDVVVPNRDGLRVKDGVTLDHLLQIMDGMLTPHGAIFLMTTNEPHRLDSALVRSGRMDLHLEFSYLEDEQASRMVERFVGRKVDLPTVAPGVMPAELAGIFKRHLRSREEALPEIRKLLETGSSSPLDTEAQLAR